MVAVLTPIALIATDTDEPRDAECLWFYGMVSHATCPMLDRTRVHAFLLHEPTKTALLMPVGDHTYWTAALTGADREVNNRKASARKRT